MAEENLEKIANANKNNVKVGSTITFNREKFKNLEGVVEIIREETVIIRVSDKVKEALDMENNLTVVNHKKYKIIDN